eukprot:CAMPEP_0114657316 /NCGR_PEP_ID=MMETSP0191-20121206/13696_1 /TAXON_ID=126664 /ORGANISM="Sorites sp." /LENGTH=172 /DNA_ID=CAMNT_0001876357 /DNA_START=220 /DNA_END=735 /DNA_ORIENTATION=-
MVLLNINDDINTNIISSSAKIKGFDQNRLDGFLKGFNIDPCNQPISPNITINNITDKTINVSWSMDEGDGEEIKGFEIQYVKVHQFKSKKSSKKSKRKKKKKSKKRKKKKKYDTSSSDSDSDSDSNSDTQSDSTSDTESNSDSDSKSSSNDNSNNTFDESKMVEIDIGSLKW